MEKNNKSIHLNFENFLNFVSILFGAFFVIQSEAITVKAIFVFKDQKMKIALAVIASNIRKKRPR